MSILPRTSALFLHSLWVAALLAPRLGSSMVPKVRHAPAVRRNPSGSVRSRTYILVREPISAYADFLSAGFPLIRGSRHGGRERARRVRYLHHHLSGAGGVYLPSPAKRAGSAHGSRTAALRPVFRPRCGARCDQ